MGTGVEGATLMQDATKWISNLSLGDPAVWLAIAAFLFVLLGFTFLGRKPSKHFTTPVGDADPGVLPTANWNNNFRRLDEKRKSVRRQGVPTPLHVIDGQHAKRALDAYVLDRSTGGIRIAIQKPVAIGANLQVRPVNSGTETPWIPVLVRNCKEVGDYYEVGCQFERELPWNLLLMFG